MVKPWGHYLQTGTSLAWTSLSGLLSTAVQVSLEDIRSVFEVSLIFPGCLSKWIPFLEHQILLTHATSAMSNEVLNLILQMILH